MDIQALLPKIKEHVEKAKDIAIVTHGKPTADSMGAALSLYLGLTGLGKKVSVVSPDSMTVEFSNFVGANKLTTKLLGKRNFVISLPYQEGSIEKVSYNIEGDKFNLVIEPRPGFTDFSKEHVVYSESGGKADLLIVIDAIHLGQLGSVYEENKEIFSEAPIINIDCHEQNTMYGAVNMVDTKSPTTTELIAVVMSFIGVKLSKDIATNLLNAVDSTTDHFQSPKVNARTFEVASVCMKAGGERLSGSEEQIPDHAPVVMEAKKEEAKKEELSPNIFDDQGRNS